MTMKKILLKIKNEALNIFLLSCLDSEKNSVLEEFIYKT